MRYNSKIMVAVWGVIIICLLFVSSHVKAADMQVVEYDDTIAIYISGDFVSGDSIQFHDLLEGAPEVTTVLLGNSDGGLIENYEIALTVHDRGLHTVLLTGSECVSYCALIYEAGDTKVMEPGTALLYHSVYLPPDYVVYLIDTGYCTEEVVDGVVGELCGQEFETMDIVVGLEEMNRDTLKSMLEFMFYIDMDQQLILDILDHGPSTFHVVYAK